MKELPVEDEEPHPGSEPEVEDGDENGGVGSMDAGVTMLETRKGMCYLIP